MPDIKLRDGSGVEQTYTGIDTITVPLADGSGTWTYGLTDEELTFSNQNYLFTIATTPLFKRYLKRFKFAPKTDVYGTYYDWSNFAYEVDTAIDLRDIIVDANDVSVIYINSCSQNSEISSFPTIINANNLCIGNGPILYGTNDSITETEILKFLNYFTYQTNKSDRGTSPSNQNCSFVNSGYCYSILNPSDCLKKWHEIINNEQSYSNYSSEPYYNITGFNYIKELKNIPIPYRNTKAITSNIRFFGYSSAHFPFTNSMTFATNNGEPYKVNWKNQTIDLSGRIGYSSQDWSISYEIYGQGYWKEKNNIFYNTTDLEQAKLNYNKLKSQDNWFSWSSKSGTYEGKNVYYSLLFSRYNHDSAVETINSLPDTSEYLTSAGGTNTIKFKGIQGALTDGGAINTLTEAEIAVATEKGWTVSMV